MNSRPSYAKILNFYRAYCAIDAAFDAALSQFGLSSAQWDVLRLLREQPGASGADIARGLNVTPQAVATMLQRLEKAGLLDRRSPARGRAFGAYLTSQGKALLQRGDCVAEEIDSQVFSTFTLEEQEHFNQALLQCIENLETVQKL